MFCLRCFSYLVWIASLVFLVGCVGPTTPFGPISQKTESVEKRTVASGPANSGYQLKFHPKKQVLHDAVDFSVEIQSRRPLQKDVRLRVTHNGHDVSESFLRQARVHRSSDQKTRIYIIEDLRLKTLDPNQIQFQLVDEAGIQLTQSEFETPTCSFFEETPLAHLGAFHAPEEFIGMIEGVAKQKNLNPSMIAGVVAQESAFNPKAVSWAKAIGLTQITPVAEKEIVQNTPDWPRYPGINSLSYLTLKSKISLGEIDDQKEWRLNPEKSLEGGATYFNYLKKYWSLPAHQDLLKGLPGDLDVQKTDLILASYNSGAARVKKALIERGEQWRSHASLKEAAKYIKKVNSYCFHYSKREVDDDNET